VGELVLLDGAAPEVLLDPVVADPARRVERPVEVVGRDLRDQRR